MNTLTKMVTGLIGQLKPAQLEFDASQSKQLPAAVIHGGMPLMQALCARRAHGA